MTVTDDTDDTELAADAETGACERCGEVIATSATKCPECGNHPYKSAKWSGIGLMVAGVFMIWIPPVGILLFIVGLGVRLGAGRLKPIDHDFGGGD